MPFMSVTIGVWIWQSRDWDPVAGSHKCMYDFKCLLQRVGNILALAHYRLFATDVRSSYSFPLPVIHARYSTLFLSVAVTQTPSHNEYHWCCFSSYSIIFLGYIAHSGNLEWTPNWVFRVEVYLFICFFNYLIYLLVIFSSVFRKRRLSYAASCSFCILFVYSHHCWKLVI